jgi:hypothetical protein
MSEAAVNPQVPDWEKLHEVAIALLGLTEHHCKDRLRVRPEIPFLDAFEQEGWIEDSNTSLGWVELTEAGQARAREMLRKHFGIVVPEPESRVEPPRG